MIRIINFIIVISFVAISSAAQSGGQFIIEKSVIAGGGNTSSAGTFVVRSTMAQPATETGQPGWPFSLSVGFWTPDNLNPTAATVAVKGRVVNSVGRGIANTRMQIVSANGQSTAVLTGPFGYFTFENITAGETYVVFARAKRYTFKPDTQIITVNDQIDNVMFVAMPN